MELLSVQNQLPSVLTAEGITAHVANSIDCLVTNINSSSRPTSVTNVHHSWSGVNLPDYILYHLWILNDTVVLPIQDTLFAFFSGSIERRTGCTTIRGARPKATTMIVSSFELATVFFVKNQPLIDKAMEKFKEDSFVLLLPGLKTSQDPPKLHDKLVSMSKRAMMGKIIHAAKSKSNSLVSIHVNASDMNRMDWCNTYTLIICNTNATSSLSTMGWLHKECADPRKGQLSAVLTPHILAASNKVSDSQLTAWDKSSLIVVNNYDSPSYLSQAEIDISCIIENEVTCKARPGAKIWPHHTENLYIATPCQLEAIRFALCHHVAVISGSSSTENTYIANKLALLMSEALDTENQPILVLANAQSTLDTILSDIIETIPGVVAFAGQSNDPALLSRQATRLVTPDANDNQFLHLERQFVKNQSELNALFEARYQIIEHDPALLCTTSPPQYYRSLKYAFQKSYPGASTYSLRQSSWIAWATCDKKTRSFLANQSHHEAMDIAQYTLESNYLNKAHAIFEANHIQSQFKWIAKNPVHVLSIIKSINWPFTDSLSTGQALRYKLNCVWNTVPLKELWVCSKEQRTAIINALGDILKDFIDQEIGDIIQDQIRISKEFDDLLTQKWKRLCHHNRVIGLTADFSAAHRDWISTLGICAVIVDEASEILESTLVSSLLSSSTEHVVLLGKGDKLSKFLSSHGKSNENAENRNVSLFKRWIESGGEVVSLDKQRRRNKQCKLNNAILCRYCQHFMKKKIKFPTLSIVYV